MIDIIKYALSNLWDRKLRSFLTILSILIGITAIIALSSLGIGLYQYTLSFAQEQGADKLFLMPGGFVPPGTSNVVFTEDDVDFIRKVNGVSVASGSIAATAKVKFKDFKEVYVYAFGMSTDQEEQQLIKEMFTIDIIKGRNLKRGDVLKAVLGYNYLVPDRLFKKALGVGDKIEVNDVTVEVIGFYEEVGSPTDDAQVYLSLEGASEIFGTDDYEYVYIRSAPGEDPRVVAEKVQEKFRKHRGQRAGEEDFVVQTFEDALATFTNVLLIIVGMISLIALISVVVAAVNIMNTMYTSIIERTQEIGIMKSIGATNRFILLIFMFESGVLGFVGGLAGLFFGYLIGKAGGAVTAFYGVSIIRPAFPWWLTLGSLLFSVFVGTLAGLLPAVQASKLNPVDALRYE